jgi:hypothetical protein
MVDDGEIEIACPACAHKTVYQLSRLGLDGDPVCARCAQSLAGETKQLSRAIAQTQKSLNATIRGLKRKS